MDLDLTVALYSAAIVIVPAVITLFWGMFVNYSKISPNQIDDKIVELVNQMNLVKKAQEKIVKSLENKVEEKKKK
jgi:hypothetical protein